MTCEESRGPKPGDSGTLSSMWVPSYVADQKRSTCGVVQCSSHLTWRWGASILVAAGGEEGVGT